MKFLLTSCGMSNDSIRNALVDLLGKPISESSALCIPTAVYAMPGGAAMAYQLISGSIASPLCELGWKSLGVLELTALPSIDKEVWAATVQESDALLVWGGDPVYLSYWMKHSGLADLLPSLRPETVYVGVSAGSIAMASMFGETYFDPPYLHPPVTARVQFRGSRSWSPWSGDAWVCSLSPDSCRFLRAGGRVKGGAQRPRSAP